MVSSLVISISELCIVIFKKMSAHSIFLMLSVNHHLLLCVTCDGSSCLQVQYRLESTEVVAAARMPYRVKVTAGKRYAWCACGHSKKQVSVRNSS